jgi:hypothetical protein
MLYPVGKHSEWIPAGQLADTAGLRRRYTPLWLYVDPELGGCMQVQRQITRVRCQTGCLVGASWPHAPAVVVLELST